MKPENVSGNENSALVSRDLNFNGDRREPRKGEKPRCDHCKRTGHTRENCWNLNGKPPNWKRKGDGRAFQVSSGDQGSQFSAGNLHFTKEQLENLCKLLQSSNISVNFSPLCSLAKKGNYLSTDLFSVNPKFSLSQHTTTGFSQLFVQLCYLHRVCATDPVPEAFSLFVSYNSCAGNQKIKIADGSLIAKVGKGSVAISPSITLKDILYVPNLSYNLLSISKLTRGLQCQAQFFPSHCEF